MLGTAMPKTSIDEDEDSLSREHDIGLTADSIDEADVLAKP